MATMETLPLPVSYHNNNVITSSPNPTLDFSNFEKIGLLVAPSTNVVVDHTSDYDKLIAEGPLKSDNLEIVEDHEKLRHSLKDVVPRKGRTCRVIAGKIIYNPEKGSYYYADGNSMYTQKVESRKSKKHRREDDDYGEPMYTQKVESRKFKKHRRDDDDYGEPSKRKKKKKSSRKFEYSDNDYEGFSKKKKKSSRNSQKDYEMPNPLPELPDQFKEYIDKLNLEVPPLYVSEKWLTRTDLNPQQSRLSFPETRVNREFLEKFLTEAEREGLKKKVPIKLNLVDDNMNEYNTVNFTRWLLKERPIYVLTTDWNTLASELALKVGMTVRAWCFRVDSRMGLCFSVDREIKEEKPSKTSS